MLRFCLFLLLSLHSLSPQTFVFAGETLKVQAEIDGKAIKTEELKVEIRIGKRKLALPIVGGEISTDLLGGVADEQSIALRVTYKRYVVEFTDLYKEHFQGQWNIIITTAPNLDKTDLPDAENVDYAYRIEFRSGQGTTRSRVRYKRWI